MYERHSLKYNKSIKIIHPGEFFASNEDELIGTLLGSCVALCLHDGKNGVAGMNHFMLPGRISSSDIFSDRSARYGITAVNKLLAAVQNFGAVKANLTAKIFGGGHVLDFMGNSGSIPMDNIRVARVMMEMEDIEIVTSDVGDNFTRKLMMDVRSGKVYLKKSTKVEVFENIMQREQEFVQRRFHGGKD